MADKTKKAQLTAEMTNYEIHQQLYKKAKPISQKALMTQYTSIGAWFSTRPEDNYYTLMCREKYDFTTFHFNNMNYMAGMEKVRDVLQSRGRVIDIQYNHQDDAYECWVKDSNGDVAMYYLFDSEFMVVEVE